MEYEDICKKIQSYLSNPPLVVWGSGATIGFGLPSMSSLMADLKDAGLLEPDAGTDLEQELGRDVYDGRIDEIRKFIREKISAANKTAHDTLLSNSNAFEGIRKLTTFCTSTDIKLMNVVSTNYDLILEYVWGYFGHHYTDGFPQDLNKYSGDNFKEKNIINLYKVHGSINWYKIGSSDRKCFHETSNVPIMIPPGRRKYESVLEMPYRDLIQRSDDAIAKSKSYLVVGFGFNDHHLTPKIRTCTLDEKPIVVVTKAITDTTRNELSAARRKIFVEADHTNDNNTHITIIENGSTLADQIINGDYWKLEKFMTIL